MEYYNPYQSNPMSFRAHGGIAVSGFGKGGLTAGTTNMGVSYLSR